MDLSYDITRRDDRVIVSLVGEVDLETSPGLRETLLELASETPVLVADCSRLTFIDSTGLAALLAAHKAMAERSGTFEIADPPGMLSKMISIVGLGDVFTLTSS